MTGFSSWEEMCIRDSPKIVHIEGQVWGHHSYQGDIFKIQPLGYHLGSHQNGDFLFLKPVQKLLMGTVSYTHLHTQG